MKIIEAHLDGVKVIEMDRFEDERGWFMEVWNKERYRSVGVEQNMVQTNVSSSARGVLRGLHYQSPQEQGKLVSVLVGTVFDVVVDIRTGSPDFGRWYGCDLSDSNRRQLWVPEGFAHGFLVTSDHAVVHYGCTSIYVRASDRAVAWNDPELAIEWPRTPTTVSPKDSAAPYLSRIAPEELPSYRQAPPDDFPPR